MKTKILTATMLLVVSIISCKKTFINGGTATQNMANSWWVNLQLGGANLTSTPYTFVTYNTSDHPDSMWVDDLGNLYNFKCTVAVDYTNFTFSTSGSNNLYYPVTVVIKGGTILPKAGHSRTGKVVDSIYMKAHFSDDPTDTFTIAGTARTGFPEDDY